MKHYLVFLLIGIITLSCQTTPKNNTLISGEVMGLKKGKLYLERIQDSALVIIDSIRVDGDSRFSFSLQLDEPEMLYLFLQKTAGTSVEDGIAIFAEPGEIQLHTRLNNFEGAAQISGSRNQEVYDQFKRLNQRFKERELDLIAEELMAKRNRNKKQLDEINAKQMALLKSRYLAVINFSINHSNYEVAPFLALTEIYDTSVAMLDSIYVSLSPEVKNSRYGLQLKEYLQSRK